ncbi:TPA: hypothetical protein ACIIU8_004337 [Escherichia coli]
MRKGSFLSSMHVRSSYWWKPTPNTGITAKYSMLRVTALEEENTTLRQNLATAGTRISTLENQVSELVALVRQLTGSEH